MYVNYEEWGLPNDITSAGETFNQPGKIELLLGAFMFYEILCSGKRMRFGNFSVSQGTALGWTVVGSMPITLQPQPPNSFVI
jgi:hypothetical protein